MAGAITRQRDALRSLRSWLNYQFEHGLIDESVIPASEKKAQNLLRDIASMVVLDSDQVVKTGEQMIVFHAVWSKAA